MAVNMKLDHIPSDVGKGKWQDKGSLWNYKMKRRAKNKAAKKARRKSR